MAAVERLEAWASLIERPDPAGDNRLLVDADTAMQHAKDIRLITKSVRAALDVLNGLDRFTSYGGANVYDGVYAKLRGCLSGIGSA